MYATVLLVIYLLVHDSVQQSQSFQPCTLANERNEQQNTEIDPSVTDHSDSPDNSFQGQKHRSGQNQSIYDGDTNKYQDTFEQRLNISGPGPWEQHTTTTSQTTTEYVPLIFDYPLSEGEPLSTFTFSNDYDEVHSKDGIQDPFPKATEAPKDEIGDRPTSQIAEPNDNQTNIVTIDSDWKPQTTENIDNKRKSWQVSVFSAQEQPYLRVCGASMVSRATVISGKQARSIQLFKIREQPRYLHTRARPGRWDPAGWSMTPSRNLCGPGTCKIQFLGSFFHRHFGHRSLWRLTSNAAHCFWKEGEGLLPASQFAVGAGEVLTYRLDDYSSYRQQNDVGSIKVPPTFNGAVTNYQHDIAVVHLAKSFYDSTGMRPVCISFDEDLEKEQMKPGNIATTLGVGLLQRGKLTELQTLKVPYVSSEDCKRTLDKNALQYFTEDKICAGFEPGTSPVLGEICIRDPGAGLAFHLGDNQDLAKGIAVPFLRGVASRSHPCDANQRTLYTNVRIHRAFLEENIQGVVEECGKYYPQLGALLARNERQFICNCYC
ncbi:uncharacterized protein LOC133531438 isoform X1 [Cydia pomonella]|uniref:uncharacterized protein LOC133531438 isoform X1 n=1 Tax=Cydia pomonella TaxID=82600 RepID=UPI002ADD793F|nr:uncharacterized protein LOC133531438 isoform X1 [Cydia pomonella]